jgi:hypothetical protein
MALGAARSRVIGTVIRGAVLQAVAGLAIGIPVALFCVRYVKSQLYEITSVNASVMGCITRFRAYHRPTGHNPKIGLSPYLPP